MKTTIPLLAATLLLAANASVATTMYQWVDKDGVTHFGERPPVGQQAQQLHSKLPASSSQQDALDQRQQRLDRDAERRNQEQRQERASNRSFDEQKAEICQQHQANLETLTNKATVRRENPETGEMEVLGSDQREQLIDETRQALSQCD